VQGEARHLERGAVVAVGLAEARLDQLGIGSERTLALGLAGEEALDQDQHPAPADSRHRIPAESAAGGDLVQQLAGTLAPGVDVIRSGERVAPRRIPV
jgi:hypothetical protein